MSDVNDNKSLDEFFQLACSLLENQRISKAMEVFEKLLLADYNPSLILPYMIQVSMMKNDLNGALNYIDLSLDENPDDIELLSMRASILLEKHRFEDALDVSNQILILDMDNDAGVEIKLSALKMLQRFDELEDFIKKSGLSSDSLLEDTVYGEEDLDIGPDALDEEFNKFNSMDISKLKELNNNSYNNSNNLNSGYGSNNEDNGNLNDFLTEKNVFIKADAESNNEENEAKFKSPNEVEFDNVITGEKDFNQANLGFISGNDIQGILDEEEKNKTNDETESVINNNDLDLNENGDLDSNDDYLEFDGENLEETDYNYEIDKNIPLEDLSFKTAFDVKSDENNDKENKQSHEDYYLSPEEDNTNTKMDDDLLNDFLSSMDKQIYDDYGQTDDDFAVGELELDEDYDGEYNSDSDGNDYTSDSNDTYYDLDSFDNDNENKFNPNIIEDNGTDINPNNTGDNEEDINIDQFIQDLDEEREFDSTAFDEEIDMDIEDLSDVPILVDNYNIPENNDLQEEKIDKYDDLDLDEIFNFDEDGNLIEDEFEENSNLKHFNKKNKNNDEDEEEDYGLDYVEEYSGSDYKILDNSQDDENISFEDENDEESFDDDSQNRKNSENPNLSLKNAKNKTNNVEVPLYTSSTLDAYFNFSSGK